MRLVRIAATKQRAKQPVPRAIAGEDPAGSVTTVRRGGQADDQDPCLGISEAGHRTAPVLLIGKGSALLPGDCLSPLDEPRTRPAVDDDAVQRVQAPIRGLGQVQAGLQEPPDVPVASSGESVSTRMLIGTPS